MSGIQGPRAELSPELLDLLEYEKVIERGLGTFIEVGCALFKIKADRKYLHAGYDSFEVYCRDRWEISRPRAYQLVAAASIATELMSTAVDILPETERQVRPLTLLKNDDDRREAWVDAVESADGGQPTAVQVEQAVNRRQPLRATHVIGTDGKLYPANTNPPRPKTQAERDEQDRADRIDRNAGYLRIIATAWALLPNMASSLDFEQSLERLNDRDRQLAEDAIAAYAKGFQ